jgi:dTDP-4-dehydrorhamnose 3,5-epimerase
MIDGVKVRRLKRHLDERGYVMEILRDDDPEFIKFGQIYITTCNPGIVKAWHMHEKQFDTFCVIKGTVKIGLYDDRPESPTCGQTGTVIMSELEPVLLQIPPRVWHGQMSLGGETSYLINLPTEHYNRETPDELRKDPFDPDIGYEWEPRSG